MYAVANLVRGLLDRKKIIRGTSTKLQREHENKNKIQGKNDQKKGKKQKTNKQTNQKYKNKCQKREVEWRDAQVTHKIKKQMHSANTKHASNPKKGTR